MFVPLGQEPSGIPGQAQIVKWVHHDEVTGTLHSSPGAQGASPQAAIGHAPAPAKRNPKKIQVFVTVRARVRESRARSATHPRITRIMCTLLARNSKELKAISRNVMLAPARASFVVGIIAAES
jgi:hypothetical protein